AAHLATGTPLSDVGPVVGSHATLEGPVLANGVVTGRVLMADRFGNVVTSIPRDILDAVRAVEGGVRIRIGDAFLERLHRTFSDVGEGLVLAYVGSGDHLEIAVNRGSAAETLGLDVGTPIRVEPGPP
ncbi:MAG: SAM hydrolase/SAM-dependent halogenase family protein, partial [Planctomycetota bacterium]